MSRLSRSALVLYEKILNWLSCVLKVILKKPSFSGHSALLSWLLECGADIADRFVSNFRKNSFIFALKCCSVWKNRATC